MTENHEKLNALMQRLDALSQQQQAFSKEINALRAEILLLKGTEKPAQIEAPVDEKPFESAFKRMDEPTKIPDAALQYKLPLNPVFELPETPRANRDFEKFIGENLINKIGIAILVIGVAIGAKYSIEHKLISPATRIILGYITGLVLAAFGIKLKKKYEGFSAVLVSGAIAILYFITYAAYSFYALMPQPVAFVTMVLLTIAAVWTAIKYNRQVIAHIGLVGAYAVPLLIGEDTGHIEILFSYVAIINIGILAISFLRYWKLLLHASFVVTWLLFNVWFLAKYDGDKHVWVALLFAAIFFAIFYASFICYKLFKEEKYLPDDVVLITANAFIFFGVGYSVLNNHEGWNNYLTLFTIGNAAIHALVSLIVSRKPAFDKSLQYLLTGLSLIFATIAVPVYFDGKPVTIIWAGEAALLFYIGRSKAVFFYEKMAYPVMLIALVSLLQNWSQTYVSVELMQGLKHYRPLLNTDFLTSAMFAGFFALINYINRNERYPVATSQRVVFQFAAVAIPSVLLVSLYYSFYFEIERYWNLLYNASLPADYENTFSRVGAKQNDLHAFKKVWLINYSLLFVSVLAFVNLFKIKNKQLAFVNLAINVLMIASFLTQGLYTLSELRESYLAPAAEGYKAGDFNIYLRYISYIFAATTLYTSWRYIRSSLELQNKHVWYDALLHVTIIWVASSELINWMSLADFHQSYKLGLSILWGVYALLLIVPGILMRKRHLRIGAICLFAVTLIKLFFYDIASLDSIAKTIVFVSLGVLLLVISFLYNKYRNLLATSKTE